MNAKSYKEMSRADQIRAVLANAAECGLVVDNTEAYINAISTDVGRAMKEAGVSQTLWKVVSTVPVSARAKFPRLVGFGTLEELLLLRLRAESAVSAWNASDLAMNS